MIFSNTQINTVQNGTSLTTLLDAYHKIHDFICEVHTTAAISIVTNPIIYNFKACNFENISFIFDNLVFILNLNFTDLDSSVLKFYEIILDSFDIFVSKF